MTYQTTINMDHETVEAITYCPTGGLTENESVTHALASYAAAGYTADQINSIETVTYESA